MSLGPLVLAGVLTSSIGCRTVPRLQPASDLAVCPDISAEGFAEDAVTDVVAGIEVLATTEGWVGPFEIPAVVTTVRVAIRNTSDRPLRLDYDRFSLLTEGREPKAHPAVSPRRVRGAAANFAGPFPDLRVGGTGYAFDASRLRVRSVVGGWPRGARGSASVRGFPGRRTIYFFDNPLVLYGLRPGVVPPGGQVEGWLFFRDVDAKHAKLTLNAELVDADTMLPLGAARLPFENVDVVRERSSEGGA